MPTIVEIRPSGKNVLEALDTLFAVKRGGTDNEVAHRIIIALVELILKKGEKPKTSASDAGKPLTDAIDTLVTSTSSEHVTSTSRYSSRINKPRSLLSRMGASVRNLYSYFFPHQSNLDIDLEKQALLPNGDKSTNTDELTKQKAEESLRISSTRIIKDRLKKEKKKLSEDVLVKGDSSEEHSPEFYEALRYVETFLFSYLYRISSSGNSKIPISCYFIGYPTGAISATSSGPFGAQWMANFLRDQNYRGVLARVVSIIFGALGYVTNASLTMQYDVIRLASLFKEKGYSEIFDHIPGKLDKIIEVVGFTILILTCMNNPLLTMEIIPAIVYNHLWWLLIPFAAFSPFLGNQPIINIFMDFLRRALTDKILYLPYHTLRLKSALKSGLYRLKLFNIVRLAREEIMRMGHKDLYEFIQKLCTPRDDGGNLLTDAEFGKKKWQLIIEVAHKSKNQNANFSGSLGFLIFIYFNLLVGIVIAFWGNITNLDQGNRAASWIAGNIERVRLGKSHIRVIIPQQVTEVFGSLFGVFSTVVNATYCVLAWKYITGKIFDMVSYSWRVVDKVNFVLEGFLKWVILFGILTAGLTIPKVQTAIDNPTNLGWVILISLVPVMMAISTIFLGPWSLEGFFKDLNKRIRKRDILLEYDAYEKLNAFDKEELYYFHRETFEDELIKIGRWLVGLAGFSVWMLHEKITVDPITDGFTSQLVYSKEVKIDNGVQSNSQVGACNVARADIATVDIEGDNVRAGAGIGESSPAIADVAGLQASRTVELDNSRSKSAGEMVTGNSQKANVLNGESDADIENAGVWNGTAKSFIGAGSPLTRPAQSIRTLTLANPPVRGSASSSSHSSPPLARRQP